MGYGWQTKSWRNSTEKRSVDKERAEETARYLAERAVSKPRDILLYVCTCRSFHFPHDPERHKELPKGDLDWRTPEERQHLRVYQPRIA